MTAVTRRCLSCARGIHEISIALGVITNTSGPQVNCYGDLNVARGTFRRWAWPFSIAAAGIGTAAVVLLRGCWHMHMSWPTRYDDHYSYRVCTECGIKRLFDPESFRGYGPYSYDLKELIARDRARRMKRQHPLVDGKRT